MKSSRDKCTLFLAALGYFQLGGCASWMLRADLRKIIYNANEMRDLALRTGQLLSLVMTSGMMSASLCV